MAPRISVIIPNHNGAATIGLCLEAALGSDYADFEVIVVDDFSSDSSIAIIEEFPCKLIRLKEHSGASMARNTGVDHSSGELLFFTDADCILQPDTLRKAAAAFSRAKPDTVIGGTYTPIPHDRDFFSIFQSVFIHYSETKTPENPDYIATHAMLISAAAFKACGGFDQEFMPILEDVEFSHRLRRLGYSLRMDRNILVQHVFNFSLLRSLQNGFRKSRYWTAYSLKNRDLLSDSGTASREFKFNILSSPVSLVMVLVALLFRCWSFMVVFLCLTAANLYLNRKLAAAFLKARGPFFAASALLYYTLVYPLAVGTGAISGIFSHHPGLAP